MRLQNSAIGRLVRPGHVIEVEGLGFGLSWRNPEELDPGKDRRRPEQIRNLDRHHSARERDPGRNGGGGRAIMPDEQRFPSVFSGFLRLPRPALSFIERRSFERIKAARRERSRSSARLRPFA